MEKINCDFCGSKIYDIIVSNKDVIHESSDEIFHVVRCSECGLHYTNPRPDSIEISKYYTDEYSFHEERSFFKQIISNFIHNIANSRISILFCLIPFIGNKIKVYIKPKLQDPVYKYAGNRKDLLDIGCGNGITAHFWGSKGALKHYSQTFNVYGVEVSEKARSVCKMNNIKVFPDLISVDVKLKFDIIRMNWSLEHVHSPSDYFKFVFERLNKGGLFIISVPNYDGLLYKYNKELVELPIHLYHFTIKDIKNYADKFNFDVLEITTFSYPQMYNFAAKYDKGLKRIFTNLSFLETYFVQKGISLMDKLNYGNDMIFVLKKNPSQYNNFN